MGEPARIAEQSRKMFASEAWHGPAVLEILADLDAETAAAHPIAGAHSIWELALHLAATQEILLRRVGGEAAGLSEEEFWPPVPPLSAQAWRETVARLERQEATLQQAIAAFPEERLDAPLMEGGTPAYNNFHGHIQHNAYHAGQMSLLKKAQRARRP